MKISQNPLIWGIEKQKSALSKGFIGVDLLSNIEIFIEG
jgi:hypothetical protein